MAIQVPDEAKDWNVGFSLEELSARIRDLGLPRPLLLLATGDAPPFLRYACESPVHGLWPLQDDYVPLWTSNRTQALGYEPSTGAFHAQSLEELPRASHVLGSYEELVAWVVAERAGAGHEPAEIAAFFGVDLDALRPHR